MNQWKVSGLKNSQDRSSVCSTSQIYLGGPGLQAPTGFFERTYTKLAPHFWVYIGIRITAGGTWKLGETFSVHIDGQLMQKLSIPLDISTYTITSCSSSSTTINALSTYLVGKYLHSNNNLTLRISWSFLGPGLSSASLGIDNVRIMFGDDTPNKVGYTGITLGDTAFLYSTACIEGYYFNVTNNVCDLCDVSCGLCFGPKPTDCITFNWYYSYDGSSAFKCQVNCFLCSVSGLCSICDPDYVLDIDGSCQPGSSFLTVLVGDNQYRKCIIPCNSNQFVLWNFSCVDSCDVPLTTLKDSQSNLICKYPCSLSINSYLYANGSCLDTCPYIPRVEDNYRFCDLCQPGYHLYDGGSCISGCPSDFVDENTGDGLFCHFPCAKGEFLYKDKSCNKACPSSFVQIVEAGYSFRCTFEPIQNSNKAGGTFILMQNVLNGAINTCSRAIALLASQNPAAIFLAMLADMFIYLRYLKINYPSKLQHILDSSEGFSINIIPDMPPQFVALFPNSTLPGKFNDYHFPSRFIVNFWQPTITLLALLVSLGLVSFFQAMTKKWTFINLLFIKLKKSLKWSFSLMIFISYYGEIVLFSSFDLRTNKFGGTWEDVSFSACILINLTSFCIFGKIITVILAARKMRQTAVAQRQVPQLSHSQDSSRPKGYEMLYEDFKDNSLCQQMFVPIFVLRLYLFYLVIAYIENEPLTQIVLITLMNVGMLVYLGLLRPHKSKIELIVSIVEELVILIVNICVLALAILDEAGAYSEQNRNALGDIIVWINTAFSVVGVAYLVINLLVKAVKIIQIILQKRNKKNMVTPFPAAAEPDETSNQIRHSEIVSNNPQEEDFITSTENQTHTNTTLVNESNFNLIQLQTQIGFSSSEMPYDQRLTQKMHRRDQKLVSSGTIRNKSLGRITEDNNSLPVSQNSPCLLINNQGCTIAILADNLNTQSQTDTLSNKMSSEVDISSKFEESYGTALPLSKMKRRNQNLDRGRGHSSIQKSLNTNLNNLSQLQTDIYTQSNDQKSLQSMANRLENNIEDRIQIDNADDLDMLKQARDTRKKERRQILEKIRAMNDPKNFYPRFPTSQDKN